MLIAVCLLFGSRLRNETRLLAQSRMCVNYGKRRAIHIYPRDPFDRFPPRQRATKLVPVKCSLRSREPTFPLARDVLVFDSAARRDWIRAAPEIDKARRRLQPILLGIYHNCRLKPFVVTCTFLYLLPRAETWLQRSIEQ